MLDVGIQTFWEQKIFIINSSINERFKSLDIQLYFWKGIGMVRVNFILVLITYILLLKEIFYSKLFAF